MRVIKGCILSVTLLAMAVPGALARAAETGLCQQQIVRQEVASGLPPKLLEAIGLVESGRRGQPNEAPVSWPWTLNVDGRAYFYPDKAEALAAILRFQREGAQSIDVGCMQINLRSHPHAFRDLAEALEPQANVAYAASFLKGLFGEDGDWASAVAKYHSRTAGLYEIYRARVLSVWRSLDQGLIWWPRSGVTGRGNPPPYADKGFDQADPIKALLYYKARIAVRPGDPATLLGQAIAIDHMVAEGIYPPHQARLAYAQALAADSQDKAALERLLKLVGNEPAEARIPLLEGLYRLTGGPAALPARLGDLWAQRRNTAAALFYYRQAAKMEPSNKAYQRRLTELDAAPPSRPPG